MHIIEVMDIYVRWDICDMAGKEFCRDVLRLGCLSRGVNIKSSTRGFQIKIILIIEDNCW